MTDNPSKPDLNTPDAPGPSDAKPEETASPAGASANTTSTSAERPKAPDLKGPSGAERVRYTLFSRETRSGRFLRALLRWATLAVVIFGLGFFTAYLLLFQPANQALTSTRQQSQQLSSDLEQAQKNADQAQQSQKSAQDQSTQAQTRLDTELTRVQVLRAANALTSAQMAVQGKDKAAALKSITTAETALKQVEPRLQKMDANQVSTLQALITLAKNDLNRDLALAAQDLTRLQAELSLADRNLK